LAYSVPKSLKYVGLELGPVFTHERNKFIIGVDYMGKPLFYSVLYKNFKEGITALLDKFTSLEDVEKTLRILETISRTIKKTFLYIKTLQE